ncbi:MAG TPA: beta-glucosidase [Candidatus Limnocylindrales bacterium]|nr:beta-glucosidase [Candidatus Limnocylindrales bacterium]
MDANTAADARAREIEQRMTDDERFSLLVSAMGQIPGFAPDRDPRIPEGTPMSAGYTPGVARLGIPALRMSDASMGVTNPGYVNREGDTATAFPASILLGASFNPKLARAGGRALALEARSRGFNVQLAGGINLARDPRNGRNFEYFSEDPYLSAVMCSEQINGIQGEGVISTIKHYTLNCNEVNRHWLDAVIDPAAHRESDLLAFEIAIERSQPGSVMSGYNKINGAYASGNHHLLNGVLKETWGYQGWVMSDWGATAEWEYALHGLDQESGLQLDRTMRGASPFVEPLREAYEMGKLPKERLSDMVRRILRSIFAVGIDAWDPSSTLDINAAAHHAIALEQARQGIVLLRNDGTLPLKGIKRLAVIGGHAATGVPSGTGSATVVPQGGYAAVIDIGGAGPMGQARKLFLLPSSPLAELRRLMPGTAIEFDPGINPAEAALLAKRCDAAVVFGIRVEGEGFDFPDLSLPWGQDAVIEAVADVNAATIVVLETGNPVAIPWLDRVRAVLQAWYPGQAGGQAIAEVLAGQVNPSGRLPVTFPTGLAQTPRPDLPGLGTPWGTPTTIHYNEGAEIGYRWFAKTGERPLFPFGHGLGYTSFDYSDLTTITDGDTITAIFTVINTGERAGADVPQLYLTEAVGDKRLRLLGFQRLELAPGESGTVKLIVDPRLFSRYQGKAWRIESGIHRMVLGRSSGDPVLTAEVILPERTFGR